MTLADQLKLADRFIELWEALMPELAAPKRSVFLMWLGTYPEKTIARGINRAAAKSYKLHGTSNRMSADDAVRYAASVMRREATTVDADLRLDNSEDRPNSETFNGRRRTTAR